MCCEPVASGRRCRKANSGAAVRFISIFWTGKPPVYLCSYGKAAYGNTMKWKALPGNGKVWMGRWSRRLWQWSRWAETRRIGGKKGSKRSLLTDQKGVPLSIVLSGANTHDVKLLAATLDALVIERPEVENHEKQHLCLDAGYVGEQARQEVLDRNYVPHIRPRGEEVEEKVRNPDFKPKRWVVEVCHSWFNRFRKILVRYEKMERSYLGLLMLAAAVIVFRKIKRQNQPNIIYG
jgi:transposase